MDNFLGSSPHVRGTEKISRPEAARRLIQAGLDAQPERIEEFNELREIKILLDKIEDDSATEKDFESIQRKINRKADSNFFYKAIDFYKRNNKIIDTSIINSITILSGFLSALSSSKSKKIK